MPVCPCRHLLVSPQSCRLIDPPLRAPVVEVGSMWPVKARWMGCSQPRTPEVYLGAGGPETGIQYHVLTVTLSWPRPGQRK